MSKTTFMIITFFFRAVIDKLHQDCEDMARANGDMVIQIRNCYTRVKGMLKPNQTASQTGWYSLSCKQR